MLTHYAAFALRLLRRSPAYSAIAIGGFAIALASCILVLIFVRHELGYDAWLRDVDEVYRIDTRFMTPGRSDNVLGFAFGPIADRLATDPDVAAVARMDPRAGTPIVQDGRSTGALLMLADPSLFDVLDLPLASGERALADLAACVVTEPFARKQFGGADPIGRALSVRIGGKPRELRVTGVLRALPAQTHLAFDLIARLDPLHEDFRERIASWENVFAYTYVRLRPGADPAAVEQRIAAAIAAHSTPLSSDGAAVPIDEHVRASLVAVRDVHFDGAEVAAMQPGGDRTTLYAIAGVGILLLLIAIANFINLTTARAARRAREIAIRKATGAQPRDIVIQYLGEAVVIALCALVVALMLVEIALPWFEQLAARELAPPHDLPLLAALVAGTVAIGVASGIYPAFVLARYQPAAVMNQNQASLASGSGRLRSVLVFAQFTAAIALVFGTIVVLRQTRYGITAELGFAKRDRLVIEGVNSRVVFPMRAAWLDQMARLDGVAGVALGSESPGSPSGFNTVVNVPGAEARGGMLHMSYIDVNYFSNLMIAPLAGRAFSRDIALDDSSDAYRDPRRADWSLMLNEAAVRRLGLGSPRDAVGRALEWKFGPAPEQKASARVIGVVPDVRLGSLRNAVEPTVYALSTGWMWAAIVQYRPGSGQRVRAAAEALWTSMFPEQPFVAEFVDVKLDALYRNEQRLAAILSTAALLALAVACLGLYGLAAFLAESRRKEIAIRKVLGASSADIVRLLAWRLARPIALACVVAAPLAYLAAERWLGGFAYRITIGPLWIAATIGGALAIAAATVAAQGLRSARATPIDALRAE